MVKKCLFFIFSWMLATFLFTAQLEADSKEMESTDIWLVKSKDPVFTIWLSGRITRGEPSDAPSFYSTKTILNGHQFIYARQWYINGNAVHTFWRKKPIIYEFYSEGGEYKIGLAAKNFASKDPSWTKPDGYTHFEIDVYVGNRYEGRGKLFIEASDTRTKTDYLVDTVKLPAGPQKIKLSWRNDAYNKKKKQDANLEIHQVIIEKVPARKTATTKTEKGQTASKYLIS